MSKADFGRKGRPKIWDNFGIDMATPKQQRQRQNENDNDHEHDDDNDNDNNGNEYLT